MDPDSATQSDFEPSRMYLNEVSNELYTSERNANADTISSGGSCSEKDLDRRPRGLPKNYHDLTERMRQISEQKTIWRNKSTVKTERNGEQRRKSPNPNKDGPVVPPRKPNKPETHFNFPERPAEYPQRPPREPSPPIPPRIPRHSHNGEPPAVPPRPHRTNSSAHVYEIEGKDYMQKIYIQ